MKLGKIHGATTGRLWAAGVLAVLAGVPIAAAQPGPSPAPFQDAANRALNLRDGALVHLTVPGELDRPLRIAVPINGRVYTLDMAPYSVRGDNFQIKEQLADGSWHNVKAGPINTLRGTLAEQPEAVVAGGLMPEGLYATVLFADGSQYWIQPLGGRVAGAAGDLYSVYRSGDVVPGPQHCGTTEQLRVGERVPPTQGGTRGSTLYTAQIATDADFEYFAAYGSTGLVVNRINLIINTMNVQYEREVDIHNVITTMLVRTTPGAPYTSTDAGTLLGQFQGDWNANHGGITRDTAHLYTGKELDSNTIGIAFIGVICNTGSAYGLVQSDFNDNFMSSTDLSAHEMGHNWSATHCTCSGNGSTVSTMNPFITSINRFTFSNDTDSVGQIRSHRNSRSCLSTGGGGIDPPNDLCDNAAVITEGTIGWNNAGAANDGPVPSNCGSGGQIGSDIWYSYTAPCDGVATASLCGSNHDTVGVVYTGSCGSLTQVTCNDDFCGATGLASSVTWNVSHGTRYLLRLGGYNGAQGDGLLFLSQTHVNCSPPSNNNCASARTVVQGDTPFDNIDATTDGPVETAACNFFSYSQVGSDVWFRFLALCNGTVRVSTCGANFDSKIAIYQGGCPSTFNQAIACDDDDGPSCTGTRSSVDFAATYNTIYLIRVGGYNGAQGVGTLNIQSLSCPPPDNDRCADAQDVSGGGTFFGNLSGASNDGSANCGSSSVSPDVWYSYTACSSGTLTVTTCGTNDTGGVDQGMDTVLSLHSGCPGTSANQVGTGCNDDAGTCGSQDSGLHRDSAVSTTMTAGQTVKIRVSAFSTSVPQSFLLNVTFSGPSNDNCPNFIAVGNGAFPVCNQGATQDGLTTGCRTGFSDVWYRYTAACSGSATVDVCNSSFDSVLFAYNTATCPPTQAQQLACNDDACGPVGLSSRISFPVTSGARYMIRLASFGTAQGSATMTIACTGACPVDVNHDGQVNVADFLAFLSLYSAGNIGADFTGDGVVNVQDFLRFLQLFSVGC
jgi:hypothetical protein